LCRDFRELVVAGLESSDDLGMLRRHVMLFGWVVFEVKERHGAARVAGAHAGVL
jgi:hypothetical protein